MKCQLLSDQDRRRLRPGRHRHAEAQSCASGGHPRPRLRAGSAPPCRDHARRLRPHRQRGSPPSGIRRTDRHAWRRHGDGGARRHVRRAQAGKPLDEDGRIRVFRLPGEDRSSRTCSSTRGRPLAYGSTAPRPAAARHSAGSIACAHDGSLISGDVLETGRTATGSIMDDVPAAEASLRRLGTLSVAPSTQDTGRRSSRKNSRRRRRADLRTRRRAEPPRGCRGPLRPGVSKRR